jgi:hypothetical protein
MMPSQIRAPLAGFCDLQANQVGEWSAIRKLAYPGNNSNRFKYLHRLTADSPSLSRKILWSPLEDDFRTFLITAAQAESPG